ncbi:unnamed protein product, partial [Amoebophrya sp. A25]|eukprot:GSA25T00003789001.1
MMHLHIFGLEEFFRGEHKTTSEADPYFVRERQVFPVPEESLEDRPIPGEQEMKAEQQKALRRAERQWNLEEKVLQSIYHTSKGDQEASHDARMEAPSSRPSATDGVLRDEQDEMEDPGHVFNGGDSVFDTSEPLFWGKNNPCARLFVESYAPLILDLAPHWNMPLLAYSLENNLFDSRDSDLPGEVRFTARQGAEMRRARSTEECLAREVRRRVASLYSRYFDLDTTLSQDHHGKPARWMKKSKKDPSKRRSKGARNLRWLLSLYQRRYEKEVAYVRESSGGATKANIAPPTLATIWNLEVKKAVWEGCRAAQEVRSCFRGDTTFLNRVLLQVAPKDAPPRLDAIDFLRTPYHFVDEKTGEVVVRRTRADEDQQRKEMEVDQQQGEAEPKMDSASARKIKTRHEEQEGSDEFEGDLRDRPAQGMWVRASDGATVRSYRTQPKCMGGIPLRVPPDWNSALHDQALNKRCKDESAGGDEKNKGESEKQVTTTAPTTAPQMGQAQQREEKQDVRMLHSPYFWDQVGSGIHRPLLQLAIFHIDRHFAIYPAPRVTDVVFHGFANSLESNALQAARASAMHDGHEFFLYVELSTGQTLAHRRCGPQSLWHADGTDAKLHKWQLYPPNARAYSTHALQWIRSVKYRLSDDYYIKLKAEHVVPTSYKMTPVLESYSVIDEEKALLVGGIHTFIMAKNETAKRPGNYKPPEFTHETQYEWPPGEEINRESLWGRREWYGEAGLHSDYLKKSRERGHEVDQKRPRGENPVVSYDWVEVDKNEGAKMKMHNEKLLAHYLERLQGGMQSSWGGHQGKPQSFEKQKIHLPYKSQLHSMFDEGLTVVNDRKSRLPRQEPPGGDTGTGRREIREDEDDDRALQYEAAPKAELVQILKEHARRQMTELTAAACRNQMENSEDKDKQVKVVEQEQQQEQKACFVTAPTTASSRHMQGTTTPSAKDDHIDDIDMQRWNLYSPEDGLANEPAFLIEAASVEELASSAGAGQDGAFRFSVALQDFPVFPDSERMEDLQVRALNEFLISVAWKFPSRLDATVRAFQSEIHTREILSRQTDSIQKYSHFLAWTYANNGMQDLQIRGICVDDVVAKTIQICAPGGGNAEHQAGQQILNDGATEDGGVAYFHDFRNIWEDFILNPGPEFHPGNPGYLTNGAAERLYGGRVSANMYIHWSDQESVAQLAAFGRLQHQEPQRQVPAAAGGEGDAEGATFIGTLLSETAKHEKAGVAVLTPREDEEMRQEECVECEDTGCIEEALASLHLGRNTEDADTLPPTSKRNRLPKPIETEATTASTPSKSNINRDCSIKQGEKASLLFSGGDEGDEPTRIRRGRAQGDDMDEANPNRSTPRRAERPQPDDMEGARRAAAFFEADDERDAQERLRRIDYFLDYQAEAMGSLVLRVVRNFAAPVMEPAMAREKLGRKDFEELLIQDEQEDVGVDFDVEFEKEDQNVEEPECEEEDLLVNAVEGKLTIVEDDPQTSTGGRGQGFLERRSSPSHREVDTAYHGARGVTSAADCRSRSRSPSRSCDRDEAKRKKKLRRRMVGSVSPSHASSSSGSSSGSAASGKDDNDTNEDQVEVKGEFAFYFVDPQARFLNTKIGEQDSRLRDVFVNKENDLQVTCEGCSEAGKSAKTTEEGRAGVGEVDGAQAVDDVEMKDPGSKEDPDSKAEEDLLSDQLDSDRELEDDPEDVKAAGSAEVWSAEDERKSSMRLFWKNVQWSVLRHDQYLAIDVILEKLLAHLLFRPKVYTHEGPPSPKAHQQVQEAFEFAGVFPNLAGKRIGKVVADRSSLYNYPYLRIDDAVHTFLFDRPETKLFGLRVDSDVTLLNRRDPLGDEFAYIPPSQAQAPREFWLERKKLKRGIYSDMVKADQKIAQELNEKAAEQRIRAPKKSDLLGKREQHSTRAPHQDSSFSGGAASSRRVMPLVVRKANTLYSAIESHYKLFYRDVIDWLINRVRIAAYEDRQADRSLSSDIAELGKTDIFPIPSHLFCAELERQLAVEEDKRGQSIRVALYVISQQTGVPWKKLEQYYWLLESSDRAQRCTTLHDSYTTRDGKIRTQEDHESGLRRHQHISLRSEYTKTTGTRYDRLHIPAADEEEEPKRRGEDDHDEGEESSILEETRAVDINLIDFHKKLKRLTLEGSGDLSFSRPHDHAFCKGIQPWLRDSVEGFWTTRPQIFDNMGALVFRGNQRSNPLQPFFSEMSGLLSETRDAGGGGGADGSHTTGSGAG